MNAEEANALARRLFLTESNDYGCAETTFVVLKHAFDLPRPEDSSAAIGLNGGIVWMGNTCGVISGAALAVGMLAQQRLAEHQHAKQAAREILTELVEAFEGKFGSTLCRELIKCDIRQPEQHAEFIRQGSWQVICVRQIEYVVGSLISLADRDWEELSRISRLAES